jgi:hypothetical protein
MKKPVKKMSAKDWEKSPMDAKLDKAQAKKGIKEGSKVDKAIDKKYIKPAKKSPKKK